MNRNSIRGLLHQAALGQGTWVDALDVIATETGAGRGQLIGVGDDHVSFNWVTGMDQRFVTEFDEIDGANPQYSFRTAADLRVPRFTVCHEGHYAAAQADLRGDSYLDYCERHDTFYGCHAMVTQSDDGFVGLATLRSRDDGISSASQRRTFAEIAPHVRDAIELHKAIEGRGMQLLLGSLDALGKCAMLLDRDGRCLAMTPAAEQLLATGNALRIRADRAVCDDPRDQRAWDAAIAGVTRGETERGMAVIRRASATPIIAKIHAFISAESNLGFRPAAIVILQDEQDRAPDMSGWLAQMGLTGAEMDITRHLAAGMTRAEIAEARGSALGTVRQQVKTIYAKLGVHREAELLALLGAARTH